MSTVKPHLTHNDSFFLAQLKYQNISKNVELHYVAYGCWKVMSQLKLEDAEFTGGVAL